MCDTPGQTKIVLAENDSMYQYPFINTNIQCTVIGVHLSVGSKVWAEFKAVYENRTIVREDDNIAFEAKYTFLRCHLVN